MQLDVRDVCTPCPNNPEEQGYEYTIEGNVGSCAALATLEALSAATAASSEESEGGGGLTTAGKVTIPLGILGFLGGIVVGWYRLRSDKKAKLKAKEAAQAQKEDFDRMLRKASVRVGADADSSAEENGKKKKKTTTTTKKKKQNETSQNATVVTKSNPMFLAIGGDSELLETEDGGLYDDPGAAPHKCGWVSSAGRMCAQMATNLHCDRHTCTQPNCTNGKESKARSCDRCDIGSGGFGDVEDDANA